MSSEVTVDLYGKYSWQLIIDIDNSTNDGKIRRTETYKTTTSFSYKSFTKEVRRRTVEKSLNFGADAKFDVIGISTEAGHRTEEVTEFEKSAETHTDKSIEHVLTTDIEVGPRSRVKMYQLVFHGPGMTCSTGTLSSEPHPMKDVVINCTVRPVFFLKDINVVYTDDAASMPSNAITEVGGLSADINKGFKGKYVWLVPVYTANPSEAATSIEVIVQGAENRSYRDMAKGAGGDFRYLKMCHDSTMTTRIGSVKLWRTTDRDSKPSKRGWDDWTTDINQGRKGDFLYICWKRVSL